MNDKYYHTEISVAQRIKQLRLARGLTQKEFADSLGIVQGYLSGIERGNKIPSFTLLMALCFVYGVSKDWLFGRNGADFAEALQLKEHFLSPLTGEIALLNSIGEGFPDKISEKTISGFIRLPDIPEGCFAILADGDYMAPTVRDGDLTIFRPGNNIVNRSIVLMANRWGEVILRRYRMTGDEEYFSSDNTAYAPFKAAADTRIFGVVVDIWRKVKI
jgi:transcriptional regulator with XRE-family HTH domain